MCHFESLIHVYLAVLTFLSLPNSAPSLCQLSVSPSSLYFHHCPAGSSSLLPPFTRSTLLHPVFPYFSARCVLASSSLSLLLWCSFLLPQMGSSIREGRSCVSAQFATGTPQYLIRSAFVWRELWIRVRMSDKERCLTVCVCVDTVFVCRREADRSVYICVCVCGDSFGDERLSPVLW